MRASFPSSARVLRPSEYTAALKGRRVARGALFVVMASPETIPMAPRPRLGLIVAKRFAPLAVTRNTIKRVLRETFRHRQHDLPVRDYVFRLHAPVGVTSLRDLKVRVRAEADALLDTIIKRARP